MVMEVDRPRGMNLRINLRVNLGNPFKRINYDENKSVCKRWMMKKRVSILGKETEGIGFFLLIGCIFWVCYAALRFQFQFRMLVIIPVAL